ncbi:MAG: sulfite exporter TauE/SafE family protein [Deltaproteobacteria bacterium]|nr:sulfite exporter TauE/SafE family protein [Deltaproteobacteria bacterium]
MTSWLAEPLLLGLSSGLLCLSSCGPVLVPWIASEPRPLSTTAGLLGWFLAGRLIGYLGFAVLVWAAGMAMPLETRTRTWLFALAHLALAVGLIVWVVRKPRAKRCQAPPSPAADLQRTSDGKARKRLPIAPRPSGSALSLGLMTGLNLCAPFVAAAVRAMQTGSLTRSLAFFSLFFLGTAVWFVPSIAVAWLSRLQGAAFVARLGAGVIATYYAWLGTSTLVGAWIHG